VNSETKQLPLSQGGCYLDNKSKTQRCTIDFRFIWHDFDSPQDELLVEATPEVAKGGVCFVIFVPPCIKKRRAATCGQM
jgi:hypothetical protein